MLTIKNKIEPMCPLFGQCSGCSFQDISYQEELEIKKTRVKDFLQDVIADSPEVFEEIVPSPKVMHYRNRIDLRLLRTLARDVFIGFTPKERRGCVIPVDSCVIAAKAISDFIPELKRQAIAKLPERKFRLANLTVRSGDDGRVLWGGIGRRSCQLKEEDYLWTMIEGRKIFYSLDTFFQANLSILPKFFECLRAFDVWKQKPMFYDLYGGVGLFGIALADKVNKVVLIEDCKASITLARYNVEFNQLKNFEIISGRVEDALSTVDDEGAKVVMIDPPRVGLSDQARELMTGLKNKGIEHLFYLSCNPEALACDLKDFVVKGWQVKKIIPFDFFPQTQHVETLVYLQVHTKSIY